MFPSDETIDIRNLFDQRDAAAGGRIHHADLGPDAARRRGSP
jgi:hypothetical protein